MDELTDASARLAALALQLQDRTAAPVVVADLAELAEGLRAIAAGYLTAYGRRSTLPFLARDKLTRLQAALVRLQQGLETLSPEEVQRQLATLHRDAAMVIELLHRARCGV